MNNLSIAELEQKDFKQFQKESKRKQETGREEVSDMIVLCSGCEYDGCTGRAGCINEANSIHVHAHTFQYTRYTDKHQN